MPLVVYDRIRSADVLVAVDASALRSGLRPGLALADARARLGPCLYAAPAATAADAALLDRIAADCDRYTPLVGRDAPDGVILNITGAAHLIGGEARLCGAIARRLAAAGLAARTSIAGAPDPARALARYGQPRAPSPFIVPQGGDAAAVSPLPVAALRLPPETVTGLVRAGLKTIGCLARRPRAPLAARFGPGLIDRLERTLGDLLSPISPWRPEPVAHADLACGEPIMRGEDIDRALAFLAAELTTGLAVGEQGARRVEAAFFRVDGEVRRITVAMARPCRDAAAITRLLAERLAALAAPLDPGFGFDRIRLAALHVEPMPPEQAGLGRSRPPDDGLPELIDRLSARFGSANVTRCLVRDSHIPERATVRIPATQAIRSTAAQGAGTSHEGWAEPKTGEPPSRPASLFEPPQPIEAIAPVPDGPPLRFRWRRIVHDIVLAEGPERIAPEWWRLDPFLALACVGDEAGTSTRSKPLPREDISRYAGAVSASRLALENSRPDALAVLCGDESGGSQQQMVEAPDRGAENVGRETARPLRDWLSEVRDYYRVEDRQGRRYWLFRAGLWQPGDEPPRWFMHGLFA